MTDTPTSCCHRRTHQLVVNIHFQVRQEMLVRAQRRDVMAHHQWPPKYFACYRRQYGTQWRHNLDQPLGPSHRLRCIRSHVRSSPEFQARLRPSQLIPRLESFPDVSEYCHAAQRIEDRGAGPTIAHVVAPSQWQLSPQLLNRQAHDQPKHHADRAADQTLQYTTHRPV